MLSYLAFIHRGIESTGDPLNEGKTLAQHCVKELKKLEDPEQFPPRLLILLASPAYLDSLKSEQLLNGVIQVFDEAGHRISDEAGNGSVELMGCSVAAVFFDRRIYHKGALLICLASRLLEAKVRASINASHDPEKAVKSLLPELNLLTEEGEKIHSFAQRTLFALFPGFGGNNSLAPKLHESLRRQLGARIPIFGGVASAADPEHIRAGILFANRKIYRNALVAARVECGTPFGISLSQGLTDTGSTFNVSKIDSQDRRVIRGFRDDQMSDVMKKLGESSPMPLLANLALDRDPRVDMPRLAGGMIRLAREVIEGEALHLLRPEPETMRRAFRTGVEESLQRAFLLNPIAGLGFRCAGLLRYRERIGLDLEYESALIERDLSIRDSPYDKPFVGGYVDGEAGVDKNGKSVLGTWSNAALVFGDELRFRTPVYRGFEKLADFAGRKAAEDQKEGIDRLTRLVYDIGFPGAMISFCFRGQEPGTIIAQSASGSRYKKLLGEVKPYSLDSDDTLAVVVREKKARPIIDSRKENCGSMEAASKANIVSQYIMPLTRSNGDVIAVLQIDLGDISYDSGLYQTEKIVLAALGKIINAGLNHAFNLEESKIVRKLNRAMNDCLSAETIKQGLQQYLEHALKAFGLRRGHIRIADEDKHYLMLIAGVGDYFEESRKKRLKIDFDEASPTARAFGADKTVIVNDTEHSEEHQEMCRRCEDDEALCQRLREIGSYANVPFKSERGERGTINLISSKHWVFTWFHENALKALRERVGFLLETLRRKEQESFLLGVTPRFSQIKDLDDGGTVLANEIKRFAETTKAPIASLYLWEKDRERYILRAQHGWYQPEWVNAAYYEEDEFWAGRTAIAGRPRYISDLFDYYTQSRKSARRYTVAAFGRELSSGFTVEAIGLQLRIADVRLGVLTLYRRINPGDESGFFTTDTALLQRGADNVASLISILQAKREDKWRKREHIRRQEVYDATVPAEVTGGAEVAEDFESRVCRQALKSYRATKARFYKVEVGNETQQFELRAHLQRDPQADQVENSVVVANEGKLVRRTAEINHHQYEKKVLTERVVFTDNESHDPKRVALADFVRRACIPLVGERQLVGLLDLHWSFNPHESDSLDYKHNGRLLRVLGEVVGSAYRRTQVNIMHQEVEMKLKQSERRNIRAVQTTSAYVLQHHHELRNVIQEMASTLGALEDAFAKGTKNKRPIMEALSRQIRAGSDALSRMIDIGSKITYPTHERLPVKNLIDSALKEKLDVCKKYGISVEPLDIPDDLSVDVDPVLINIVFRNLLDNAIAAMKEGPTRVLSISATANADGKTATTAIKDTGIGMTEKKKEHITNGFFSDNGRIGVGVQITKLILAVHDGTLKYVSTEGSGTEAQITLPLNYRG